MLLCLQVGLPGFDSMPSALNMLSKHERASYCNHHWEIEFKKVCFCKLIDACFIFIITFVVFNGSRYILCSIENG